MLSALLTAGRWFLATPAGRVLLAIAAALGALWIAYAKGKSAERQETTARALGRDLENRRTRDAVDRAVARDPDPAERLRRDWSRD